MNKEELIRAKALAPVPITTPLCGWDETDITDAQVQYLVEEDNEDYINRLSKALAEIEGERTEQEILKVKNKLLDEIRSEVSQDQDIFEQAFDDLCENLTETLMALSRRTALGDDFTPMYFKLEVKNFGWQSRSGYKYVKVMNGKDLIRSILPDTPCTYRFFKVKHGKKLAMQNFHHDSPMGNEWYVITPCAYSTYEKEKR